MCSCFKSSSYDRSAEKVSNSKKEKSWQPQEANQLWLVRLPRKGERSVPVRKVKGGYRWGKSGKIYKSKKAAERQGRAIYASGYKNATLKKRKKPTKRAGVKGYNKPKRTPRHPKKSHIVVAKVGHKVKTIRFGQQGAKTAGKPKKGESAAMKRKRASFKARHRKNIAKGKMSAAYWADKVKW